MHDSRTCGHDHHMDKLLSDPEYKANYEKRIAKYNSYVSTLVESRATCSSPVTIPVAVHFQGATGNMSCLITAAQEAIAVLNADYQGTNSDITNWTGNAAGSFPGVSHGEACLEFVLADQNHPSGHGLTNGDLAVTRNTTSGDSNSDWSGYLNIYVNDGDGALGYSPLGGAGNGDGVVINRDYFGVSGNCGNVKTTPPYDLGRTLTHEVGHYLLLDHIWGNGCGQDDGVADTPNQASDYSGCPNLGASSCGSTDMHMNYMDYSNDACMYMFSAGQATVSENYVASNLTILTNNVSNVISGNTGGGGSGGGTTCATPSFATAQVLGNTSAKITWEGSTAATQYQLRYRVDGTTSWTNLLVNNPEYTITGLTAGTTYDYRVRTQCPTGWTGFTAIQEFTTTGSGGGGTGSTCDKPGYSATEYLTAARTKVTWESMTDAIRYQIRYRVQGTTSWTTKSSTSAQKTLNGLQNGAIYQYRIRTKCPSGWTSFTTTETFVQSDGTGGGSTNNTIHFELVLDDYGSETSWELVNSSGQVVESGGPYADNNSGQVILETFSLADGCYTIYVDDSYGDGICCAYGNGSFEILDINNSLVGYSDGNFGFYDYIDFCVTNNVASFKGGDSDGKQTGLAPKVKMNDF